jgi:hypothetical protein
MIQNGQGQPALLRIPLSVPFFFSLPIFFLRSFLSLLVTIRKLPMWMALRQGQGCAMWTI